MFYSQVFYGKLGIHFTNNLALCARYYVSDVEPSSESNDEQNKRNAAHKGDDNLEEKIEEMEDVSVLWSSWRKRKSEVAHRGEDDESDEMDTVTDCSWRRKRTVARRGDEGQSKEEKAVSISGSP